MPEPIIIINDATKVAAAEEKQYDVIVVGGGPAGYIAAIKAARLGAKTALVEKGSIGGTCLNRGCIPTKAFLKTAEYIEHIKHAGKRGILLNDSAFSVDMKSVVAQKNAVVKKLTGGVSSLLKNNGVDVFYGAARIKKDRSVEIDGKQAIRAQKVIYAGGSKAARINIQGIESELVLTSDDILDIKTVPKSLAIIGGGVIGVEIATAFDSFGSKVTIIELEDRILPAMDESISLEISKTLRKKGIEILVSSKLLSIIEKQGCLTLNIEGKEPVVAEIAMLSIGRAPDLSGVAGLGLKTDTGRIVVDNTMKTSVDWLYAPGDINGRCMLAHAAFKMGETAAMNAVGRESEVCLKYIPSCVYTEPEIGSVGLTEKQAAQSYDISIGRFHYGANGRALASGEGTGFVKVITDKRYGEVLGVHIVGPGATEVINEAAALMNMEITVYEIADIIHGHPTYSEAFMEAAADSIGECLHLSRK